MDWPAKRCVVTGGHGFLGSHLVERLNKAGCGNIVAPPSSQCDLLRAADVERLYAGTTADIVFHLAARVGGIGANQANPGAYFHDNMLMGINVLEQARRSGARKVVLVGTVCSYPKLTLVPFHEADLWNGYPEETNAPYGVAKKALLVMAEAYRRQYGVNTVCLLPANLYGPRDNFHTEEGHVIPAMIRKFLEAAAGGKAEVVLWGDGTATREFLYVDDCVTALMLAAEHYDSSEPVNIGTGVETSILSLALTIARLTGYEGRVRWDTSRPNGQPRRMLDTTRASERFGFEARTPLEVGLRQTIDWHKSQLKALGSTP